MNVVARKAITLGLSLVMLTTIFSGCGKTNSDKSTKPQASASASKEKTKITWASFVGGPVDKNSYAEQELEKAFPDVDFDLWSFERATWTDQINTRVAGGDIPDIVLRDTQPVVASYVKQGILAEVPFDVVKKNAPGIFKAAQGFGSDVWLACNVDGKNYGLPNMQTASLHPFTDGWRQDWLEKVGITKIPETIDEYEDAFTKFTNNDPDGNGQKDTYGLTFRGKDLPLYMFTDIFSAYGVFPNTWALQKDGTVKFAQVTAEAKQALTTLNKWYKKGIIDPEFVTTDNAVEKQKWANSKIGFATWMTYYRLVPGGEYYDALKTVKSDAKIAMGPAPKGPDGKFGYLNWGYATSSTCFGKQLGSQPEKLAKAMQVIDKISNDQELYGKLAYGKEGEHWKRSEKDNSVEAIAPYNDAQKTGPIGKNFFSGLSPVPSVQVAYASKNEPENYKYAEQGTLKNGKDYIGWIGLFLNTDITKQTMNSETILNKWIIEFITGAKPLDQFDQFVKEWEAAGGAQRTKDANDAYKNGASKKAEIAKNVN